MVVEDVTFDVMSLGVVGWVQGQCETTSPMVKLQTARDKMDG